MPNKRVYLNCKEMRKVFRLMEEKDILLSIDLADGAEQVPEMEEIIAECPRLRIAIGHFGMAARPGWLEQIKLARHPNVMIESGGITWLFNDEFYPFEGAVWAIKEAAGLVGMEKLMWGSDYPRTITAITYRMSYDFGFCGSDLNTFTGRNPMVKLPVIPGHEISAAIEKATAGVPEMYKAGTLCTVSPYTNCGYCTSCRNGRPNACRHNETLGVQRNGAMCEYIALPWQKVIPVSGIPARDIALVEPMSVGFHAVARGQVTDTDIVMVIGCGMVGMGAIIRSATRGATVIAMDIDDEKLTLARQLGAAHTINSRTEDYHAAIAKLTEGNGPDVIIEAVGSTPTYRLAIEEASFTGRVIYIRNPLPDKTFRPERTRHQRLPQRHPRRFPRRNNLPPKKHLPHPPTN